MYVPPCAYRPRPIGVADVQMISSESAISTPHSFRPTQANLWLPLHPLSPKRTQQCLLPLHRHQPRLQSHRLPSIQISPARKARLQKQKCSMSSRKAGRSRGCSVRWKKRRRAMMRRHVPRSLQWMAVLGQTRARPILPRV